MNKEQSGCTARRRRLNELLRVIGIECQETVELSGISDRAQEIGENGLFVALQGTRTDGRQWAELVRQRGGYVLSDQPGERTFVHPDPRSVYPLLLQAYYDYPALKLTMIGATCVTTAGFLLGEFMPRLAVGMFTSDEELIRLAVEGMRIVFFCFPIIGFQMVATNFFMSIGMAGKAIFLSLSRQLLFLMPGLIFLPHIFDVCTEWNGSWGVWCSMPLSDFLASLVAFFMLTYQLRKFRAIGAENAAKEG